jgi:HEAT repeat protein
MFGRAFRRCAPVLAVLVGGPAVVRGEDLDSVMYAQPEVPVARVAKTYPGGLVELWRAALEHPEHEMRSRAALALAQAHEGGMPGTAVAVPVLIKLLERPDEHPAVLAAAVRALVVMDARAAAPAFLRLAKAEDPDLSEQIELALARWDHEPARAGWLARIGQAPPHRASVMLAIRCLGTVRDERAVPRLRELALGPEIDPPVRLAAARALGTIRTSGSEADALKLSSAGGIPGRTARLVAASLLRHHKGAEALRVLQSLAKDPDPSVALIAVTRLGELDTRHVLTVLTEVLANEGAEVRGHGVAAMIRNPSDDHVRLLTRALSDPHPDVRVLARRGLRELAADRRALVIEEAVRVLNSSERRGQEQTAMWRGQEQTAILLVQLDHKPAAQRLVELLTTNRSEVAVAAGWGLRQLAVAETLPAVLDHVKARHAALLRSTFPAGVTPDALDRQMSQLVQFIGQARYEKADPALRALVPRIIRPGMPPLFTPVRAETRAAALWALGLIHEGKPAEALVSLAEGRLIGDGIYGADDPRVGRMAAVALGRMRAKQSLQLLRDHAIGTRPSTDVVTNASRWAVGHLTQEPVPPAGVVEVLQHNWFLTPLR